jgi:hypothetical protein
MKLGSNFWAFVVVVAALVIMVVFSPASHAQASHQEKMVCMAADYHQVGIDDDASVSASGLQSCVDYAKAHPEKVAAICDLDSPNFSRCLSENADVLVKRGQPAAWYTSHVTVINELNHTSQSTILLLPRHGTLNVQFAGATFTIKVDEFGKMTLNMVKSGPNQTVFINT